MCVTGLYYLSPDVYHGDCIIGLMGRRPHAPHGDRKQISDLIYIYIYIQFSIAYIYIYIYIYTYTYVVYIVRSQKGGADRQLT